jgi:hypothetical protein
MGDPTMASLIRVCTQCDATDDRQSWSSTDEAADAGVFKAPWTCSTCAWTEFDLVESPSAEGAPDPDRRRDLERAGVASGSRDGVDPTFRSPA